MELGMSANITATNATLVAGAVGAVREGLRALRICFLYHPDKMLVEIDQILGNITDGLKRIDQAYASQAISDGNFVLAQRSDCRSLDRIDADRQL